MDNKLISVDKIKKRFGKTVVIEDLSLDIFKGEVFGLIGRSGCGKSTLLKILIGVYDIDSGKIIYDNKDITKNNKATRRLVGLTTQENSFYEELTIHENMTYYSELYGLKKNKKEIDDILRSVGLLEKRKMLAGKISGGMKRRLDFAISLLHDPALLILDEPTTGLDPILVRQFWDIVKGIKKKGKTIIVISHIFDELAGNCDRVGIMHQGSIKKIVKINKKTNLPEIFRKEVG